MGFLSWLFGIPPEINPQRVVQWWEVDLVTIGTVSETNKTRFEDSTWEVVKKDIKRLDVVIPNELYYSDDPIVLVILTVNSSSRVYLYTQEKFESAYSLITSRTPEEYKVWLGDIVKSLKDEREKDVMVVARLEEVRVGLKNTVEILKKIK